MSGVRNFLIASSLFIASWKIMIVFIKLYPVQFPVSLLFPNHFVPKPLLIIRLL